MTIQPEHIELCLSLRTSLILRAVMPRLSSVDTVPYSLYSVGRPVSSVCKYLHLQIHRLSTSQDGHYRGRCPGCDAY